jgi:hypothetical protein
MVVDITGTTTITDFADAPSAGATRILQFDGALTLTHGSGITLPGGANITTAAGDTCLVYADTTTSFIVASYQRASVSPSTNVSGRNAIINGNFNVWQRGTSFTGVSNADYTVDRWQAAYSMSTGVFDVSQETTTLPDGTSDIAFRVDVTTAENSGGAMDAGDYLIIQQKIEGYNAVRFALGTSDAKQMTLSFWVYSTKIGTHCVAFRNSAGNRSYVTEYSVSSSNTWEKKTVTLTADTTGTWLTTNGNGMVVAFSLGTGSTYHGTADTWEGANDFSTSGQVNCMDSTSNIFMLSQVQLELGSVATDFEHEDYATTFAKCHRYYFRSSPDAAGEVYGVGFNTTTTNSVGIMIFPVPMRAPPGALEQSGTASDYRIRHGGTSTVCNAVPTFVVANEHNCMAQFSVAAGLTAGDGSTAEGNHATDSYLGFSAEL